MATPRERLRFAGRVAWRRWLAANHAQSDAVWVIINRVAAPTPGLTYEDAVLEALRFGWIDSTLNRVDDLVYALRFSPRRANSIWSESNKRRAAQLVQEELMMPSGYVAIETAKENGQWEAATAREQVDVIPPDLAAALAAQLGATDGYLALRPSRRKQLLYWLASAKRAATRAKRIQAIVDEVSAARATPA